MESSYREISLEPGERFGQRPIFDEQEATAVRHEAVLAWTFVAALAALIAYELLSTYL